MTPAPPLPHVVGRPQLTNRNSIVLRILLGTEMDEQTGISLVRDVRNFSYHVGRWTRLPSKVTKPFAAFRLKKYTVWCKKFRWDWSISDSGSWFDQIRELCDLEREMTRRNGIGCCGQQFPLICCLSKHKQESGSAQTGVTFKSAEHRHEGNSVISPVTEGAHRSEERRVGENGRPPPDR